VKKFTRGGKKAKRVQEWRSDGRMGQSRGGRPYRVNTLLKNLNENKEKKKTSLLSSKKKRQGKVCKRKKKENKPNKTKGS